MAERNRGAKRRVPKRAAPVYFFLNDQLHKKLTVNRGRDIFVSWNYEERRRVVYSYSETMKSFQPAHSTVQSAKILNRSPWTLRKAVKDGMIEPPPMTYGLTEVQKDHKYMWGEKNIMECLDYLSTVHIGRPRKDGEVTVTDLPTPREARALIRSETMIYGAKAEPQQPTWRAKEDY